ncbi:hypothetical protein FE633_10720 [Streptomyces montanus]|uniref:Uncharacterized protein n=1 Tax=Streptomyces montanus TaxID=2580423 RepID=A0A5R9FRM1_9ACTN|nr:hypothetical protein [Streptomyces montanus]TLS46021.1 hypothetical protein FE633_10720 [Streptomyces montanus]
MPEHPTVEAVLPKPVAAMRDDLLEATGQTADIRRTSPLHYLLRLASERVELTVTWRRNHRGTWKWSTSTLTVDGTPRELARDFDDFVRIWNDPDVLSRPGGRSELPELTPVSDETQLPDRVRQTLDNTRDTARRKDTDSNINAFAAATDSGYTIQLSGPKGTLHIHYTPSRRTPGSWALAPRHPFRMYDTNGMDRTSKFGGDLSTAMADMFGLSAAPAVPGQTGHTRQASVTNSVQVRRHTVIRV